MLPVTDMRLQGQKIGFAGLGNMGAPMARHLHNAGAVVHVWNRSEAPAKTAEEFGMKRVEQPAGLTGPIGSGIYCVNLTHTVVVEEVVFGKGGIFKEGIPAGSLVIDLGTTGVSGTRDFAQRMYEAGAGWVDAPVSGGQVGAEAANLTIMAGGRDSDILKATPLLEVIGEKITHMGEAGSGQVTKLANQLIVAQTIDAVAQALRLAELAGVDSAKVRDALRGGFAESRILDLHGERMVNRDFAPGGRSTYQLKDVRMICELAAEVGMDSPTLQNCLHQWVKFVEEKGFGELDHSGLFRLYES